MHRRRFLKVTGQFGAGLGTAVPLFGPFASESLATTRTHDPNKSSVARGLVMPLNEGWSISIDPDNVGRNNAWFQQAQPSAKEVPIPSTIQQAYPRYHGLAWYWLEFKPQRNPWTRGRYLLRFHAVDYLADVWLNGKHVGTHEGGETPFVFDVTDTLHPDRNNKLAVRVLNPDDLPIDGIMLAETPHRNKVVNFANGNFYDYGGIIEPVELLFVPAFHLSDICVSPDWQTGNLRVRATVHNDSGKPISAGLHFSVISEATGDSHSTDAIAFKAPVGSTAAHHEMNIKNHHLWDLDDPYLYRLHLWIDSDGAEGTHEVSTSFGFRDFRLVNGYFRLNGKRRFLRCTHTGNHVPFGQVIPPDGYADLLRRDLLYAKASGFNAIRFLSGVALPYQLDLCDELGLLVYEESSGSWLLKDSPQMKRRYEDSLREMIVRDRNHPSVAIWGLLNETGEGPVFREAEACLPLVRSLDDTRLVLLSSGRFDGHLEIGSASNPKNSTWEYVWGKEQPGAGHVAMAYFASGSGSGDFHLYPTVPQTQERNQMMRTLGEDSKPIFLSEYGIGSMMNVIHELRMYEQAGIPENAEDFVLMQSMAEKLSADWIRFGMDAAYPYPEILLEMSQKKMAQHRLLGFNLIRSNPKICGFNLTGMLDHAMTGEGVWRFWRDWKPGMFDAMRDGWAPVRWCLFVEPMHTYAGRPITLEAVLANEDALQAGSYPATFRVWGPNGIAWDKPAVISIPDKTSEDTPFALPVMKEEAVIHGPAGRYELVPSIKKGVAPPETSCRFYISDPTSLPFLQQDIVTLGVSHDVETWLKSHGVSARPFAGEPTEKRDVILVGDIPSGKPTTSEWRSLAKHMATGSTVIFLSPLVFARDEKTSAWLPLANKGRVYRFHDWLYHKECVAKPHQVFEGLEANGILDWYYFGPVLPSYLFDGQDTPHDVIAAAFAAGYSTPGGYASGILLGAYLFGAGQFVVNSFPVLEHIDKHPVADRLLLNLIRYADTVSQVKPAALPADFDIKLKEIGYLD
ncbi:glycoside hydrolase family 2 protein [Acidobacterium sp. S8]|uniref:glycoside hydrolase family 2 protein n=1 Tax=Acidobacterium sp. S8 TaxID=1641854 RepID=UPI00131BED36|nr:glycoside hydrolase family 2 TIM barrel-domain containing protein [Acidobacterium sp. S8]